METIELLIANSDIRGGQARGVKGWYCKGEPCVHPPSGGVIRVNTRFTPALRSVVDPRFDVSLRTGEPMERRGPLPSSLVPRRSFVQPIVPTTAKLHGRWECALRVE